MNEGTGRLYVALHKQFSELEPSIVSYVSSVHSSSQGYYVSDTNGNFPKFIGVPQADGSLNYVAEFQAQ